MRIRTYLILMAVAILLPTIVFFAVALRMLQTAELNTALHSLQETANGVALLVDRELASAQAALHVLGSSPSLAAGDLRAFHEEAKSANRGPDGWTVLTDHTAQQVVNTLRPFGSPLPPPFGMDVVQQVMSTGKTVVSDVRPGPVVQRMVTFITVPVALGDRQRYVLNEAFTTDHFKKLIDSVRVPEGWVVAIIDSQGKFIARSLKSEELVGKQARPELVAAARQAGSGQIRHLTLEQTEVYDVFTHSSVSGWTIAVAAPVDQVSQSARHATLVAALGTLAAILCAAIGAFWFGDRLVAAIRRACITAAELGSGRMLQPKRSSVVEINELHAALELAGNQLHQAQNARLESETERQALLAREQGARLVAERQNKAKDQFLAMLGHELRNPLAPISAAAQLLKMPGLDAQRLRYTSDVIGRQVAHMNSLLQDLLDVSRVTRGLIRLSTAPVDTNTLVNGAIEQVRDLLEARQQHLALRLPEAPLWINGEKSRLIQVLANLLNNACKYTGEHGHITLDVEPHAEGTMVLLRVRDDGIGMAADLLPRVFELFSQAERSSDRSQGGLGLGLALVKSLVELHGGSVTAESAGLDRGSCFTVRLPMVQAPAPTVTATGDPGIASERSWRVLIVDDNVDAAETLALLLQEAGGHHVMVHHDGRSALEHADVDRPDVLILDIGLPDMDGYELARRFRQLPVTAGALMIALTGYGQQQDRLDAISAGFDHHLAKPVDPSWILDLLAAVGPHDRR